MSKTASDLDLRRLVLGRRPFYSLDQAFYTDPAVFDADLEVIFGRHWVCVGVEPDVPEPGDTMVVDIGPHSALVVRHDDFSIRAYHNVCRHRGARLVDDKKTTVGNIVCRYHQWTYNLDGDLIFAEHMHKDFDRSCHGLKPVHVRSLGGLLFLCFAETPPDDFDFMVETLEPYVAPHDLRNAKVVAEIDLIEEGNWKLTMENNRECYHCSVSHPELTVSLFEHGFGFAPDESNPEKLDAACRYSTLDSDMKAAWESAGFPSREVEFLDGRTTGFRTERLPLDGAGESQTLDTRRACKKLLGTLTDAKLGGLSLWTQPNSWHHFMADHVVTFAAFPLSPERTLLRTKWLVHKDAVEGRDYDVEKLTAVWRATNEQDGRLVGITQAGVRQTGYVPGPYSPQTEPLVEKFASWYIGRMRGHLCG
jgi:Rieske 2Fe-2S family protein